MKKIKTIIYIVGTVFLVIILICIQFFRPKEIPSWDNNDIFIIGLTNTYMFVKPAENYRSVSLDYRKLILPEEVLNYEIDCKIESNRLVFVYVNTNFELKLVVYTKDGRKTILVDSFGPSGGRQIYPKLKITSNSYWIIGGEGVLYRVDKKLLFIERDFPSFYGRLLIQNDDTIIYGENKNHIVRMNESSTYLVDLFFRNVFLRGFGPSEDSLIVYDKDKEQLQFVDFSGNIIADIMTPSEGEFNIDADMGRLKIVTFYPNKKYPLFDSTFSFYSLVDNIPYDYYRQYIFDSRKNKFYMIPNEIRGLYKEKTVFITGQNVNIDCDELEELIKDIQ